MKGLRMGLALGFTLLVALGCTGTVCDDARDYIVSDCGVSVDGPDVGEGECASGTEDACVANCQLDAPCLLFDGSLDPTNPADLAAAEAFDACVAGC